MSTVSRGFKGRRRPSVELPPGQYLVEDFPVLSAGPTHALTTSSSTTWIPRCARAPAPAASTPTTGPWPASPP
jgi:hypothetical protein